ncbi:type VI secretion system membrane subunit TssM [Achromobacter seleniivolatilans]|uniref:Type VI secretion system membrane subunit TssM n=1 Tax=Achromobacter seleniivolatilans TaxID=3047478 RepID=A0ABY9LZR7_9BURK|nr:type VI secretion system membrane subunit TssM [Achromobacter sp. R39]WMD20249.1 type VI secretion system membrane subunit TssM [Achromobacter sp. R39]
MKRLLGFLFSWRFIAVVVLVLLAAMVWMVGPMVDLGGLRPMDAVLVRVVVICLLLAALGFWLMGWPLWIVSVAAICALVWFGGPMAAIGDLRPLAEVGVRVGVISVIVLLTAIYGVYRLFQLLRTDEALLRRILTPKSETVDADASSEVRAVGLVVSKAVGQLKRLRGAPQGWRRLLESKRYLYDLPWYMIIGTPGAGKTTAILNSGLDFPLAEQMGVASLPGAGGTANCDWWFTNEAVMIDTAGRYSDQNEQGNNDAAQVNAAEWHGFLGALRKHRTQAPINGVILAVSVAELLEHPGDTGVLASILRARLADLRHALGIRFPVYVLVTKLDLLPGFDEYFQAMTAEGRSQVWGFTLDYARKESNAQPIDLRARFNDEFALLARRLEDGLNARLVEEYGLARRKRLYPLPQEFRSLAVQLTDLLSKVFLDSRYDDVQIQRMLRGVYLTSAQQAETVVHADQNSLFERLRRTLRRLYGGEDVAISSGGREAALLAHRSYFLRNLFKQVMIPESHLVQPNRKWILTRGAVRWGVHLASAALVVWLVSGMMTSRANNDHYLAAVGEKTAGLTQRAQQVSVGVLDSDGVRLLTESATLAQVDGLDLDEPPMDYRYGLYAAPPVDSAAQATYARMLRKHLLPAVEQTLEGVLTKQIASKDAEGLYVTLGLYLSLFDTRYFEPDVLVPWVEQQWARSRRDSEREKSQLAVHLRSLFATAYEAGPETELNAGLVEQARALLQERPDATRMYDRAIRSMEATAPQRFTLQQALGSGDAALFTDHAAGVDAGVPGIFTYNGYRDVFRKRIGGFINSVWARENWMLGRKSEDATALASVQDSRRDWVDKERIEREVYTLYLRNYAANWERYINQIRLVSASESGEGPLAVNVATLRALAAADSPLARLGFALARQTTLSYDPDADSPAAAAAAKLALESAQRRSSTVMRAADALGKIEVDFDQDKLTEELVDKRFSALREVVTGSPTPGRIDPVKPGAQMQQVQQMVNDQYTQLAVASSALASSSMPPAQESSPMLFLTAETLPAPFKRILAGLSQRAANQLGRETGILLSEQVNSAVGGICRTAISGKFPFADSDQEVDPDDFVQLFAAGGLFDSTFERSLASYVDTGASPWRYKPASPGMRPIQGPDLQPFERAAEIRRAFFDGTNAKGLSYRLTGRIVSVDPSITELLLDVDGDSLRYMHGPISPFSFAWPGPRSGSYLELAARPRVTAESSSIHLSGPWAPMRLLQQGHVTATASSGRALVDFDFDGRHAVLEIGGGRKGNFLTGSLLRGFRCPGGSS